MIGSRMHVGMRVLPVLFLILAVSCSIKEDRSPCPCYAKIDIDDFCELGNDTNALVSYNSYSGMKSERVSLPETYGNVYEVEVGRKSNWFSCISGASGMSVGEDCIVCPPGCEWNGVYAGARSLPCDSDDVFVEIMPHKEFCRITFVIVGLSSARTYPYDIRVRANSNGIRIHDCRPVEGEYCAYSSFNQSGTMTSVSVPRQTDDEMVMELLVHKDGHLYSDEDLVGTFPLGKMIREQGYSWEKEDLEDIYITLDYTRVSVSVSLNDWAEEHYDEGI